ncbi:unnamed protein product [Vicia faba]|uniref:Uncharacterized protein n=1 Tax=Vicia faba TaxID=3906 RepID=A0AAV1AIA2_VICFA|nr:unnamed protein product [Vicia faba]
MINCGEKICHAGEPVPTNYRWRLSKGICTKQRVTRILILDTPNLVIILGLGSPNSVTYPANSTDGYVAHKDSIKGGKITTRLQGVQSSHSHASTEIRGITLLGL